VLRFEVVPETFALFREAMRQLRRWAGGAWDDDAALLAMARHVLAGPSDEGRSGYQVFAALRQLGFCERESQAVLSELLAGDNLRDPTLERLLREALRRIHPARY
jgi:hypothetical protein